MGSPTPDYDVQEARVTYTTKELLARIDHRFDRLEVLAEGAATRAEVTTLAKRVDNLEQDSAGTKAVARALLESDEGRWSKNEKIAGGVVAAVAVIPNIIIAVAQLFGG